LALHNSLDATLAELSLSLENEPLRSLPENLRGKCCAPLRELEPAQLTELLREAAHVRFQFKAGQIRARAKKCRLGAGFVGKSVPCPRLKAQRLADAKSGGDKTVLVARRGFGV
jgi:hypothetical protein